MVYINLNALETTLIRVQCSKTKFDTEERAEFYIKKLKATSKRTKIPCRTYLCPSCLCWHLTSKENELPWREKYTAKIRELGITVFKLQKQLSEQNKISSKIKQAEL